MQVQHLIALLQTFEPTAHVVVHSEFIAKKAPYGEMRVGAPPESEAVLAGFSADELRNEEIDVSQLTDDLVVIHLSHHNEPI